MRELFHDSDLLFDFEFGCIEFVDDSRLRWGRSGESNAVSLEPGVFVDDGVTSNGFHCLVARKRGRTMSKLTNGQAEGDALQETTGGRHFQQIYCLF